MNSAPTVPPPRPSRPPVAWTRLGGFLLLLAVVFGAAWLAGSLVGPVAPGLHPSAPPERGGPDEDGGGGGGHTHGMGRVPYVNGHR